MGDLWWKELGSREWGICYAVQPVAMIDGM